MPDRHINNTSAPSQTPELPLLQCQHIHCGSHFNPIGNALTTFDKNFIFCFLPVDHKTFSVSITPTIKYTDTDVRLHLFIYHHHSFAISYVEVFLVVRIKID